MSVSGVYAAPRPRPQAENLKFGGNTSCVEISTPSGESLIFDAGSGIRALGARLFKEAKGEPVHANIFLTHFHWDHIQGLPFFAPIYGAKNSSPSTPARTGRGLQERSKARWRSPTYPSISHR